MAKIKNDEEKINIQSSSPFFTITHVEESDYKFENSTGKFCFSSCDADKVGTFTHHYNGICSETCHELYEDGFNNFGIYYPWNIEGRGYLNYSRKQAFIDFPISGELSEGEYFQIITHQYIST